MTQAAKLLGISRQTAREHALALEAEGAVQRVPHTSPLLFQSGPRSADVEAALLRQGGDRPGRSARQVPVSAREHRGGGKWRVVAGPKVEPPWSRTWEASGVRNARMYYGWKGEQFRIWESRGEQVMLMVQPPVRWVLGQDADASKARRRRDCADVVRAFATEFGYTLQGALEELAPMEWGIPVPGMAPAGTPGADTVWVDESEGEGQAELESQDPGIIAAVAALPAWMATVDATLEAVLAEQRGQREVMGKVLRVLQEQAATQRVMVTAHVQHVANALPDSMEVA